MRKGTCRACEKSLALNSLYRVNDSIYCETCGDQELARLAANKELRREVTRLQDPTICTQCAHDNGNSELTKVSNTPFCPPCHEKLYTTEFPGWLKAGLVALAALFVFALYHGRPYFAAEAELVRGERLNDAHKYAEAVPHLEAAFAVAPASQHSVLALGKALYLSGNFPRAGKILEAHGSFDTSAEFSEVQAISDRVSLALDEANKAGEAYQGKQYDEAVKHMQVAAAQYPEYPSFLQELESIRVGAAFDRKDYDEFVRLSEAQYKRDPRSAEANSMLASAVACKYAASGDASYRQKAEDLLKAADEFSKTAEERKSFEEYAPRIRYRLDSRVIIDRDEYNRRFRPELLKQEKNEKKG